MRDNELKCPLAAVISVINLIKIIRGEKQKRVSDRKAVMEKVPNAALLGSDSGTGRDQPSCPCALSESDFVGRGVDFQSFGFHLSQASVFTPAHPSRAGML